MTTTAEEIGIPTQLGHVALRVHDVDRSVEWYTEVLGLKLKNRMRGVAFLGIREDASHEVALFPLPPEAEGPDKTRVGLYHFAWEMPSFDTYFVYPEELKETKRITVFRDFIVAKAREWSF